MFLNLIIITLLILLWNRIQPGGPMHFLGVIWGHIKGALVTPSAKAYKSATSGGVGSFNMVVALPVMMLMVVASYWLIPKYFPTAGTFDPGYLQAPLAGMALVLGAHTFALIGSGLHDQLFRADQGQWDVRFLLYCLYFISLLAVTVSLV